MVQKNIAMAITMLLRAIASMMMIIMFSIVEYSRKDICAVDLDRRIGWGILEVVISLQRSLCGEVIPVMIRSMYRVTGFERQSGQSTSRSFFHAAKHCGVLIERCL